MAGSEGEKKKFGPGAALLVIVAAILLIGWVGWTRISLYSKGLPEPSAPVASAGAQPGAGASAHAPAPSFNPPTEAERAERQKEMMAALNLNEEQRKKIEALEMPGMGEGGGERREQMASILTAEQMKTYDSIRSQRMQQKLGDSRRYLSQKDFQELKSRMENRMSQGGEFHGGGGNR